MLQQSVLESYLRQLKLPTFVHNYAAFAQDAARTGLSCERYLLALCEAEIAQRDTNRVERCIAQARLPVLKELSQFDWSCVQGVAKTRVLELAQGGYITRAEPILMIGNPGLGKSHLGAAVGHALVLAGHAVLWTPTSSFVQRLLAAKRDLRLPQELAKLDKFACVILDDIGYVQHDRDEMEVLFTFLAPRYS
jgi:DNA replication protein DnaC